MVQCFRPIPWRRGNGKKLKSSLARPWRPSMSTVHDLDHTAQGTRQWLSNHGPPMMAAEKMRVSSSRAPRLGRRH